MKKSTYFKIGMFPMVAALLLTGCKGSGGNAVVDRTLPTDDPTSEISIKFWHCLGHQKEENLNDIVKKFNTDYAGKYKVDLVKLAGDYDSLYDTVKTKLANGETPALCVGYPDAFSAYTTTDITESYILRLDNFINDKNYGYSQEELNNFVPEYLNEGKDYNFDGYWSMPIYKSTELMYYNSAYFAGRNPQSYNKLKGDSEWVSAYNAVYNKDATAKQIEDFNALTIEKKGYTYTIPTTWEDMKTVATKMIADRATEGCTDDFFPFGYDSDANLLISQFEQRGIPYTVNDEESRNNPQKHFVFNNDKAKEFVNEVVTLIKEKKMVTKQSLGGSFTSTYFTEGKLAMTVGSTGGSTYNVSSNFRVDLAPAPYYSKAGDRRYIQQGPSVCFFNNDNDYIHKGAWLFYKYLADPTANCKLALNNSYDPIRVSAYTSDTYNQWIKKEGLIYRIPSKTKEVAKYLMTSPSFVGSSEARNQIGQIIGNITRSGYSVDKAFEEALNKCKAAV